MGVGVGRGQRWQWPHTEQWQLQGAAQSSRAVMEWHLVQGSTQRVAAMQHCGSAEQWQHWCHVQDFPHPSPPCPANRAVGGGGGGGSCMRSSGSTEWCLVVAAAMCNLSPTPSPRPADQPENPVSKVFQLFKCQVVEILLYFYLVRPKAWQERQVDGLS